MQTHKYPPWGREPKLSKKKTVSRKLLIIVAIGVIALFAITGAIAGYWHLNQTNNNQNNQITGTPNLVSTNLQLTDNRSNPAAPFLHVTGNVTNNGNATANNCTVHVNAIQSGNATAIDTSKPIDSLGAGESEEIDVTFPYTGDALIAYTPTLEWTS
jgi:hypothetical protein